MFWTKNGQYPRIDLRIRKLINWEQFYALNKLSLVSPRALRLCSFNPLLIWKREIAHVRLLILNKQALPRSFRFRVWCPCRDRTQTRGDRFGGNLVHHWTSESVSRNWIGLGFDVGVWCLIKFLALFMPWVERNANYPMNSKITFRDLKNSRSAKARVLHRTRIKVVGLD